MDDLQNQIFEKNLLNEPYKIIYKVKNKNNKYHYFIYIFVGNVPQNIKKNLIKIQNLSLTDAFKNLNRTEFNELKNYYGDKWFYYFFNKYHINKFLNSPNTVINEYEKKFNIKFNIRKLNFIHKFTYGFHVERKNTIHNKLVHKILKENISDVVKDQILKEDKEDINDIMIGGQEENNEEIEDDFNSFLNTKEEINNNEFVEDEEEENKQQEENNNNEVDEEIEDTQANINNVKIEMKNNKDVDEIISKKDIKNTLNFIEFDKSKDNDFYDDELFKCYKKLYIFNQYIKDSDTIREIKEKIFFSIKNNNFYGSNNFLEPSRVYLWSEYLYENKYQPYQIEKEVIKDNKLFNFPVEPINIYSYYNLTNEIKKIYDDLSFTGLNKIMTNDKRDYILLDRKEFIDNNEIFMLDVYNEIGINTALTIQPVQIQNLYKTFIYLYFDQISHLDFNNILAYISNLDIKNSTYDKNLISNENEFIKNHYILNYSSYVLKSQIADILSLEYNKNNQTIKDIVTSSCITRIQIKVDLISDLTFFSNNIDTYTLFNELNGNSKYLFIQYTKLNGTTLFKFSEDDLKTYLNKEFAGASRSTLKQVIKWFDIALPGLTFKYQYDLDKRPLHIYIDNFGRLVFDVYESCENQLSYPDLTKYYDIIKTVIMDLNKTGIVFQFRIPDYSDFKIKFINSIKTFNIEKKRINYNDLTDFFRLFFPYFCIVLEPKKRVKETMRDNFAKMGTYLRFKKISNYQTKAKIIKTIKKYRKYYDSSQDEIINEICKEYNISHKDSEKLFNESMLLYPKLKQIKKLRKITSKTKYKTEGVNIEIQHKEDYYVIKYHGLRDEDQDKEITTYISIILYLYQQIYLFKNQKYLYIKDKLKDIEHIAKRKFEIYNIEKQPTELTTSKLNQLIDKDRIGFRPSKGKSVWTRLCQNSGKKIRRQPRAYSNVDELVKAGYKYNKLSGYYERIVKNKGQETKLKAVKLSNSKSEDVYYICGPETNGKHMYVGLLNKTSPDGKALPCCFINDKLNMQIERYKKRDQTKTDIYDINYILQPTRNIPDGRLSLLPNLLNYYFNVIQNKEHLQIQHVLKETTPDFYFAYGTTHKYNFIYTIALSLDLTIKEIINKVNKNLNDQIFNALNNGAIKTIYKTKENYLKKFNNFNDLKTEKKLLKDDEIKHLFTIPGILTKEGLNIIIITKNNNRILKTTEDLFFIDYVNDEEIENIDNKKRKNILIYNNQFEYLIISRTYKNKNDIDPIIIKNYDGNDEIIKYIKPFYKSNSNILNNVYENLYGKQMYNLLINNKFKVNRQILNTLNKIIYFVVEYDNIKNILVPVIPSGSIYDIPFVYNTDEEYNKYLNSHEFIVEHKNIYEKLKLKLFGYYYYKIKNDVYYIRELIFTNGEYKISIPIKKHKIAKPDAKDLILIYRQYYKKIDDYIKKYPDIDFHPDLRVKYMNYEKYKSTAYQYFRYNISYYINKNKDVKNQLISLIETEKDIKEIRRIIYNLIENQQLHKFYKSMVKDDNKDNKIKNKMTIYIYNVKEIKDKIENNYDDQKNNIKKICFLNRKCDNIFCSLDKNNQCVFSITMDLLIDFINRVCYEILNNGIKCYELLNIKGYYVSSVINSNVYKIKDGQKIIKKTDNIKSNVFVNYLKENPNGVNDFDPLDEERYNMVSYKTKRHLEKIKEIVEKNQPKKINKFIYQSVFNQNDTIIRAYVNCLNWIVNTQITLKNKNLGYYSIEQDKIISYIKSKILDYLISININDLDLFKGLIKNTNEIKNHKKILNYLFDVFNYEIVLLNVYGDITDIIGIKEKQDFINKNINNAIELFKKHDINIKHLIIIKINNIDNQYMEACYYIG